MNIKNLNPHLLKSAIWREFALSWRLGWLYVVRSRKWTLALTIFLMAVAFVNLVFVSSLLGGINQKIESQVRDLMVGDIYISAESFGETIAKPSEIVDQIEKIQGVKSVTTSLQVYGELLGNKHTVQAPIKIVDPPRYTQSLKTTDFMTQGDFLQHDDEIVVGRQLIATGDDKQLAHSLENTRVGDIITLKVNGKEFPLNVGGEFTTKFVNADSEAFISRATWDTIVTAAKTDPRIAELFVAKDAVSLISVRVDDGHIEQVKKQLEDKKFEGVEVHVWRDAAGYMKSISGSFVAIDAIMLVVGIFIAAVTIFIVIYVDIINKRRQIGIQRAIGVKPRVIVFSYVLLSLFYAFCGIVIGVGLFYGVLVPYYLAYPLSLPIADVNLYISPEQLILRIHIVLVVALVSGIIPAIMASRMKMLEAILGRG